MAKGQKSGAGNKGPDGRQKRIRKEFAKRERLAQKKYCGDIAAGVEEEVVEGKKPSNARPSIAWDIY